VTRVSSATDELLALEQQPEGVAEVISLLRERLTNSTSESAPGVPAIDSIARAGPGLLALRPKPLAGEQKAVDDVFVRPAPPPVSPVPSPTPGSAPVPSTPTGLGAPEAPPPVATPAPNAVDSLLTPAPGQTPAPPPR
jgi:hypothetical protein